MGLRGSAGCQPLSSAEYTILLCVARTAVSRIQAGGTGDIHLVCSRPWLSCVVLHQAPVTAADLFGSKIPSIKLQNDPDQAARDVFGARCNVDEIGRVTSWPKLRVVQALGQGQRR